MGSSYGEFVKYPRTPHLFGSKGTDDDKHVGEPESRRFIADESLIVEEKLDGTFEGRRCTVTLMSGLPGSGKDAWLAANRSDLPVVSLDDLRGQLDIDATEDQGQVTQVARERCREHLRLGRSFAFNATNIMRRTRRRWIDLFVDYDARIEIVYVEPPLPVILSQNARRDRPVPEGVIRELADKCEPPTLAEAHILLMIMGHESQ